MPVLVQRARDRAARRRNDEAARAEAEVDELEALPDPVRRIAGRAGAESALQVPIRLGGRVLGSLDLLRDGGPFEEHERVLARLAASQAALAIAAFGVDGATPERPHDGGALELAGEALAAGSPDGSTADAIARVALEAAGARSCLLWHEEGGAAPVLVGSAGASDRAEGAGGDAAGLALRGREPLSLREGAAGDVTVFLQLGRPASRLLQLDFARDRAPGEAQLRVLARFAAGAAEALRSGERARRLADELERTRALLAAVGQAIAELSLAHTLETAVEQVARLLHVARMAVYLDEGDRLVVAAERQLVGPHAEVAERLLELVLGRYRARGTIALENAADDERLRSVRDAVTEAGIEAVHAVPLIAHDDVIGLLAVYPRRGRSLTERDSELLSALAGQLAVAVQNARLHEHAKQLGLELEQALAESRVRERRLEALYGISGTFAESMSLETTLDALAKTVVELLKVDAAVIRMPDARREALVAQAIHVADPAKAEAVRAVFSRPQAASPLLVGPVPRQGEPFVLDPASAAALGGSHALLVPFLERGSTAVVVPIAAAPTTVPATLTLLSLDPVRPITRETIDTALTVVQQAALAIENARLYQQLEQFTTAMQDSLLPRGTVEVDGLDVGAVYQSSARLEVGGDLYDYLVLDDGRLAVVLGDVMGHGVEAAADMAMAKFVFRSLAREHPEPAGFLTRANDVICGEVTAGTFMTMVYLTIDAESGELACACAGHPAPRIIQPGGAVEPLAVSGLALGIEQGQPYEEVRRRVQPGAVAVLYTDGVIEARRDGEFYGEGRLDRFLAGRPAEAAGELARAVVADCSRFSGGELADDCAVVVIKRARG
jgi:serine phosphatase RsbU (regulator of sigma subunit)